MAYAGNEHLVLAVRERARLAALDYDYPALHAVMTRQGWTTLQLVWAQNPTTFHSRNPFPPGGVVDDPATGAAAAALGGYLQALGLVDLPARVTILQGTDMGRPSRLLRAARDLRAAPLHAGVDMARCGGPTAVVLREATRRAGVVRNAAYRHFRDRNALLQAVNAHAMSQLALAMEDEQDALPDLPSVTERARGRLRAVGAGYLRFAAAQPGLFRTARALPGHLSYVDDADSAGRRGRTPFQLLNDALDDLDTTGSLPPGGRPSAELLAWSAVHGLAMLTLDGPLRGLDEQQYTVVGQQLLDLVDRGL